MYRQLRLDKLLVGVVLLTFVAMSFQAMAQDPIEIYADSVNASPDDQDIAVPICANNIPEPPAEWYVDGDFDDTAFQDWITTNATTENPDPQKDEAVFAVEFTIEFDPGILEAVMVDLDDDGNPDAPEVHLGDDVPQSVVGDGSNWGLEANIQPSGGISGWQEIHVAMGGSEPLNPASVLYIAEIIFNVKDEASLPPDTEYTEIHVRNTDGNFMGMINEGQFAAEPRNYDETDDPDIGRVCFDDGGDDRVKLTLEPVKVSPSVSIEEDFIAADGETFTLNVNVDSELDLNGASVHLSFDSDYLQSPASDPFTAGDFFTNPMELTNSVTTEDGITKLSYEVGVLSGTSTGTGTIASVDLTASLLVGETDAWVDIEFIFGEEFRNTSVGFGTESITPLVEGTGISIQPPPTTIPVRVKLKNYVADKSPISFTIAQGGNVEDDIVEIISLEAGTGDDSGYAIGEMDVEISVPDGTYDIAAKQWHRLQQVEQTVTIPATATIEFVFDGIGDVNNDNYVNFDDFPAFASYFNTNYTRDNEFTPDTDDKTSWNTDFNADGYTNFDDFPLFASNFNTHGDEIPGAAAPVISLAYNEGSNSSARFEIDYDSVSIGESVKVKIVANDVTDLYSYMVEISYDNSCLELLSNPVEGQLLKSRDPSLFTYKNTDSGSVLVLGSVTGMKKGVSGNGAIAVLSFRVLSETPGKVSIDKIIVSDHDLEFNSLNPYEIILQATPEESSALQNYPNPFNPETWIPYNLAQDAQVTINIYNISGHLVRGIDLGKKPAGYYNSQSRAAYWDGRNQIGEIVSSGIYFYTVQAGDFIATRKMLLMK